jgi:hypothetical protein
MGKTKNIAIAAVSLVVIFLLILIIVMVVKRRKPIIPPYTNNSHNNPPVDNNSDNDPYRRKNPKHKKIPTDYHLLSGGAYIDIIASTVVYKSLEDTPNVYTNPELGTWTFSDELDYAVKNKEPVTITYKQSGNKILNSQSGSSVMVGGRSADGLFLITRARDNMGYYIVGTNSDSEMSEDLIWGCGKRTHVVTYKGAYGPMTIKISPK